MAISTKFVSVLLIVLLFNNSCANTRITPTVDTPTEASFEGNEQNSGIITQLKKIGPDGNETEEAGPYVITARKRDNFNNYISRFGDRFSPKLEKDYGIEEYKDGTFKFSLEAMAKLYEMMLLEQNEVVNK